MAADSVTAPNAGCHCTDTLGGVAYFISEVPPILCQPIRRHYLLLPAPIVAIRDKSNPRGSKRLHAFRRFNFYSAAAGRSLTNITRYWPNT